MRRVCVFAGSSNGRHPEYRQAAQGLGQVLAARGLTLVYGGGRHGMMGALADAVLGGRGEVIGVIPRALSDRELAHPAVSDMRVVRDMHTRKALMTQLGDAIVALPGGFGTFDELLEALTWAQLGFHSKPIGILDVGTYFGPFVELLEHALAEGFIAPADRALLRVESDPDRLIDSLAAATDNPR